MTSDQSRPLSGVALRGIPDREELLWRRTLDWHFAKRGGVTGAGGRLALSRMPGERLKLIAVSPAFLGQRAVQTADLQPLRFLSARASRLEARGRDGKPVPGTLVRWRSWPIGVTGPDGRLDLAIPPGNEPLVVEGCDGSSAQVSAIPGSKPTVLSVRLEPPRTLAGPVLQKTSLKPVPNALVWTGSRLLAAPVRAGAEGRFHLTFSTSEEVSLEAAASGHLRGESRFVPRTSKESTVLRLEPAAQISGQVVDEAGKPISGAYLQASIAEVLPGATGAPIEVRLKPLGR